MSFNNQAEIYRALLDGKKIRHQLFFANEYIFLNELGNTAYQNSISAESSFYDSSKWSIYEEPKKKVKKYLYVFDILTGLKARDSR